MLLSHFKILSLLPFGTFHHGVKLTIIPDKTKQKCSVFHIDIALILKPSKTCIFDVWFVGNVNIKIQFCCKMHLLMLQSSYLLSLYLSSKKVVLNRAHSSSSVKCMDYEALQSTGLNWADPAIHMNMWWYLLLIWSLSC